MKGEAEKKKLKKPEIIDYRANVMMKMQLKYGVFIQSELFKTYAVPDLMAFNMPRFKRKEAIERCKNDVMHNLEAKRIGIKVQVIINRGSTA